MNRFSDVGYTRLYIFFEFTSAFFVLRIHRTWIKLRTPMVCLHIVHLHSKCSAMHQNIWQRQQLYATVFRMNRKWFRRRRWHFRKRNQLMTRGAVNVCRMNIASSTRAHTDGWLYVYMWIQMKCNRLENTCQECSSGALHCTSPPPFDSIITDAASTEQVKCLSICLKI